ncbi:MAG TPA: DEAD/DEAH box helicase [Kiritimatiellia bacterium]|nr:DEAD/DEAH box helicase [Kiritimatiellia bacterium]
MAHDPNWNPITDFDVPPSPGLTRFHDLNLQNPILHAIADLGFKYCTPIQAQILPHTLVGKDAFGKAQTGTGKTAAFLIAIFDYFLRHPLPEGRPGATPRALIIAPTRELVLQIVRDAEGLNTYAGFNVLAVYGGMDYDKQLRKLQGAPVDLVVATPGRLIDFMRRRDIHLREVEVLVLDEADRMLDMGFIPDVKTIVHATPQKSRRQTLFFSATLTPDITRLATQWTRDPVSIEIEPEQVAVDTVEQIIYIVTESEKFALLFNLLRHEQTFKAIVFVNRRDHAEGLCHKLAAHGIDCELLSGAVPQRKRLQVLDQFKAGAFPVLVATDVAGRGIHVDGISHVINFNMPEDPEDYVHRIGRTGRAGASGQSISFATESESFFIPGVEEFIKRSLPCKVPDEELVTEPPPPPGGYKAPPRRPRSPDSGGPRGGGRGGPRGGGRSSGGGRRPPRR